MGAVADAVSDVVGGVADAVGDVAQAVVDTAGSVVEAVGKTVEKVVDTAVNDPIGTIAKVAAVATGQFELLPAISAVDVVAHGGDLGQALESAAISYAAPAVGGAISSELADTAFGQAVANLGESTGIESLPNAVTRGLGTAATTTGAELLRGQDVGTALTKGVTGGIGAGVGSAVSAEADTGGEGTPTNNLDKALGNVANATTTAALRGKDAYDAAINSTAGNIVGSGINAAGSGIASLNADGTTKTAEETKAQETKPSTAVLASANEVVSDSGLTPTQEAIKNMKSEVQEQTPEQKAMVDQLVKALYPEEAKQEEEAKKKEDAATGNIVDEDGRLTNFAINPETGDLYKPLGTNEFGDKFAPVLPSQDYVGSEAMVNPNVTAALVGDQEGDYPQKVETAPDGSTVVTEADGTQHIFNVDGTVDVVNPDGSKVNEAGDKTVTYDDGSTITTHADGTVTSTEATDTQYVPEEEKKKSNLDNLSSALLGGVSSVGNAIGNNAGNLLGGAALIGGAAALANSLNEPTPAAATPAPQSTAFWDTTPIAPVHEGRAYGQHMISPIYKAEGGLLSLTPPPYMQSPLQNQQYPTGDIPQQSSGSQPQQAYGQMPYTQPDQNQFGQMKPQYIQPTISDGNHLSVSQPQNYNADPSNSVNMFAGGGMPIAMNNGGLPSLQSHLGGYSDGGRMLKGPGDGMSDDIPATIAGKQPARLANEEFVIPADVVSHLGNGSSEAGAKVLYDMMARIRKARTGNSKQGKQISAEKFMPKMRG
jgi:hypothetical protein